MIEPHSRFGYGLHGAAVPAHVGTPGMRPRPGTSSHGYIARGVVMATYVTDDAQLPDTGQPARAVYVDVLTYGTMVGRGTAGLTRCVVRQGGGVHEGEIWIPKPTTQSLDGTPLISGAKLTGLNPAMLDGEHVLIEFLENKPFLPVVIGSLPHPSADFGTPALDPTTGLPVPLGRRLLPVKADGRPHLWRHKGTFFGVDDRGGFVLDLTEAHDGVLQAGHEIAGAARAPADRFIQPANVRAKFGNLTVVLPAAATISFAFSSGRSLEFRDDNGRLTVLANGVGLGLDMDDPAALSALLGEVVRDYINNNLKVMTMFGPSGPVSAVPDPTARFPDGTPGTVGNALSGSVKLKP